MKEKIDITVCLDGGFVVPTGVMMYSICENNPDVDISFHLVIDNSVTLENKKDLSDNLSVFGDQVNIEFYAVDVCVRLPSTAIRQGLTNATYYRLFLANILPDNIDKVLYLDGDVIVRHSLLPLWNTDMANYAIAAASDSIGSDNDYGNRLVYPSEAGYFNAGVLLINLKYWRENNVYQKITDMIKGSNLIFRFHDQDVLNHLFWKEKKCLSIKYNLNGGFLSRSFSCNNTNDEKEIIEARRDPVIVHFTGFFKPWEKYIRDMHPYSSTFYKYQDMTKWKNVRVDNRPFIIRIKNYLSDILRRLGIMSSMEPYYLIVEPID